MARPGEKPKQASKSVVRKIVNEHLGDFDEQVWPVNLAILVFAGFVTGIVLATTENFFDPRLLHNGFFRLGVIAVLVIGLLFSTARLKAPTARRIQFCVVLSLFLHMILAVFLREQYLKLVAFLREKAAGSTTVEEVVTIPDYVESVFAEPGALSEYEKPATTAMPTERESMTEITPQAPPVPSVSEIAEESRPENVLPEEVTPLAAERQSLQTPERLIEQLQSHNRQIDREATPLREEAPLQRPVELSPSKPRDMVPQDQITRQDVLPESVILRQSPSASEVVLPAAPPRATTERNVENRATSPGPRQAISSQTLVSSQPEISTPSLGGKPTSRQLNPGDPALNPQATPTPLVAPVSDVPQESAWTPPAVVRSPLPTENTAQVGALAPSNPPRRNPANQRDLLTSTANLDPSLAQLPAGGAASGPSSLEARESALAPTAPLANLDAAALRLGTPAADDLSAATAAMIRDSGVSRLGQAQGASTGGGEGETSRAGLDTLATQPRSLRNTGKTSGLPSLVSPEVGNVGVGGPVAGTGESGAPSSSGVGDKLAFRPGQLGAGQVPLLEVHSDADGGPSGLLSGQGVGGVPGPTVPAMVRGSADEALGTGAGALAATGLRPGRGRASGGVGLPGAGLAELAGGPDGLTGQGGGSSHGVGAAGETGSPQGGSSAGGQRGFEIAAGPVGETPRLLGSTGGGDETSSVTSSLLAGMPSGMPGRPERLVVSPIGRRGLIGREGLQRQLGGTAELDPSEAFRQRDPAQRGSTAAQYGGTPESEAAVEKGLAFLAKIQFADGHWSLNRLPRTLAGDDKTFGLGQMHGDTAATAMALLAFLGAGYTHQEPKYKDTVDRGLRWLIRNQLNNGQLFRSETDSTQYTQIYGHGLGTIALCEAYGMTRDPALREPAMKAIDYIVRSQSPQFGGWRYVPRKETDTSVTGWQLMALKSAQMAGLIVPSDAFQGVARWLDQAQVDDGARYVYNPYAGQTASQSHLRLPNWAMTAEGLLMRIYLGWQRDTPALRRGVEYLKQNMPSYTSGSAVVRDCYYWYYATQVMFQMQGETWQLWNQRMQETLLKEQVQTGPWAGSWDPIQPVADRWGAEAGRLYVTAFHLLILEVYYRHLPLFKSLAP